jgi:outer membrane protein assembly factor BamA
MMKRAIFLLCLAGLARAQNPPPLLEIKPAAPVKAEERLTLVKIDFIGLNKRAPDAALAVSELQAGQSVTIDDIEAAAQRLMDSGWFKKLGYRLKGKPEAITLTFTLEEETSANIPVVFDNFVWFSDDELAALVRSNGVIGFDGTLPEGGRTADVVKEILQTELNKKRIPGRVEHDTVASEGGANARLIFAVKGVALPICALSFPGATAVPEGALRNAAVELLNQDFSRYTAQYVALYKLRPLYRQRGYWKAQFQPAVGDEANDKDCGKGVRVSLPVREGAQYLWDAVSWGGQVSYTPPELDAALGLKPGEVADQTKFDKGLRELNQLYGRKGFLELLVKADPLFKDEQKRLGWRLYLTEGPQYKMGSLAINGLPPSDTEAARADWRIKTGDVFDNSYTEEFVKTSLLPRLSQLGPAVQGLKVKTKQSPNKQTLTVDVTIELVKADDKPPTNP